MANSPKSPKSSGPNSNAAGAYIEDERTDTEIKAPTPSQAKRAPAGPPPVRMPDMGSLNNLMSDPAITEIMVNDMRNVMVERDGKLTFSGYRLPSVEELNRITRTILESAGKVLTSDHPYVDLMLPDGSRVNIVSQPLTVHGPCITIRKFPHRRYAIEDLITADMLDQRMAYFLNACVVGRMNILISGGTGGGKTTLLNALAGLIPKTERIVTIEDIPELAVNHPNSVQMQVKPQTPSSPAITTRELVANALRMRPDRILVGECRRAEAFDMLQAMNTGHAGSMTTIHANSPRDALSRVETLCMTAGADLPLLAIRKQIVSALDLILHIKRHRNGVRRIMEITEVTGIEGDTITLQDIFSYENDRFKCLGLVPTLLEKLRDQGVDLPASFFA